MPKKPKVVFAHHEMDPVVMRDKDALVFINGTWQEMDSALAFAEAKIMDRKEFDQAFAGVAARLPEDWR